MYKILDLTTKQFLKNIYKTRMSARNAAEKLNQKYGAHRYQHIEA